MNYSMALLPGFPKPLTSGAHYEALRSSTVDSANGHPIPIQADRDGLVWAGRTMFNVCVDLGLVPKVDIVENGHDAAIQELAQRDLTVLETADLVAAEASRRIAGSAWRRPDR